MDTANIVCGDSKILTVPLFAIPKNNILYGKITDTNGFDNNLDSEGRPRFTETCEDLAAMFDYLMTGNFEDSISPGRVLELLDYYGFDYHIRAAYPEDYLRIKMRDDWFRSNFYREGFEFLQRDQECDLIEVTEEIFNSWTLARNIRYSYCNSVSISVQRENKRYDKKVFLERFSTTKQNTEGRYPIGVEYELAFPVDRDEFTYVIANGLSEARIFYDEMCRNAVLQRIKMEMELEERNKLFGSSVLPESHWRKGKSIGKHMMLPNISFTRDFSRVTEKLSQFFRHFGLKDCAVIAGGAVCRSLIGSQIPDFDIFFYGITPAQATEKVAEFIRACSSDSSVDVIRSANSITVKNLAHSVKYQIILRIYKTKAEILKGFDLQASQVLYDGEKILMTPACRYAFDHMLNIIDFERMSPSYEFRLWKYQSIGFAVYIPDFDSSKVNYDRINELSRYGDHAESYSAHNGDVKKKYKYSPHKLRGLDILLYGQRYSLSTRSDYEAVKSNSRRKDRDMVEGFLITKSKSKVITMYSGCFGHIGSTLHIFGSYSGDYSEKIMATIMETPKEWGPTSFPAKLIDAWKVKSPGEQATGTFHATVYKDISLWYKGLLYDTIGAPKLFDELPFEFKKQSNKMPRYVRKVHRIQEHPFDYPSVRGDVAFPSLGGFPSLTLPIQNNGTSLTGLPVIGGIQRSPNSSPDRSPNSSPDRSPYGSPEMSPRKRRDSDSDNLPDI
jgi:hypothetical protein